MSDDAIAAAPQRIRRLEALTGTDTDTEAQALADLLIDCVEGGASVSFMHPPAARQGAGLLAAGGARRVAR